MSSNSTHFRIQFVIPSIFLCVALAAFGYEPDLSRLQPAPAPGPYPLVLRPGDRLAVCGDSITEQKMYSRLIEDYLTMCVPQLNITVRQYGWSGEQAHGFLRRMTNDCLRFKPTIATTCYGMNDHLYRPYEDYIGASYRSNSLAIVRAFKAKGARVIQGSPGCVGKMPSWVKTANGTVDDLNVNLCNLRNIGIDIAREQRVGFADVYWPMINAGIAGQQRYGTNFLVAGNDGVHPGWAGQAMMAYAFLKSFGLYGEIGKFTVDLKRNSLKPSAGHQLVSGGTGEFAAATGEFVLISYRYPFTGCAQAGEGEKTKPPLPVCTPEAGKETDSIHAALALTKFNEELNRLMLVVMNAKPGNYRVTWGGNSKEFSSQQLRQGINLAAEFPVNPFSGPFARVDAAVAAKQAFETKQIKHIFHGDEGKKDMDAAVTRTEQERALLAQAIKSAFFPVMHKLRIEEIN